MSRRVARLQVLGRAIILAVCAACGGAQAADAPRPLALPAPAPVQLVQSPGAPLPLDALLIDEQGRPQRLGDLFDGRRSVVLVPGYFGCTQLCGLVMQGVLEALAASRLPAGEWRLATFSIDPADTPAAAHARAQDYRGYARFVASRTGGGDPPALQAYAAPAADGRAITQALGYQVVRTNPSEGAAPGSDIAHSAGFVVATPDGRIARYFPGVRFDPAALRLALVEANGGRTGTIADRLTLLCSHYDPSSGRYSLAVMDGFRIAGCLGALALGGWIWRRRRT